MICSQICDALLNELSGCKDLEFVKFVMSHESKIKPVPLEKPIVAIGMKKSELGDFIIETDENGEETKTPDRYVTNVVSINLYAPYSLGERQCLLAFDRIAEHILSEHSNEIEKIITYETNYERETQSLVLKSDFVFNLIYIGE